MTQTPRHFYSCWWRLRLLKAYAAETELDLSWLMLLGLPVFMKRCEPSLPTFKFYLAQPVTDKPNFHSMWTWKYHAHQQRDHNLCRLVRSPHLYRFIFKTSRKLGLRYDKISLSSNLTQFKHLTNRRCTIHLSHLVKYTLEWSCNFQSRCRFSISERGEAGQWQLTQQQFLQGMMTDQGQGSQRQEYAIGPLLMKAQNKVGTPETSSASGAYGLITIKDTTGHEPFYRSHTQVWQMETVITAQ